jgi:acyl-CoA synthetase (AMP-forming)/AMP-acid ligase II
LPCAGAKLANALTGPLKVKPGDRITTIAWNTHRHLELYYAVSGIGAVVHTANPRLGVEGLPGSSITPRPSTSSST